MKYGTHMTDAFAARSGYVHAPSIVSAWNEWRALVAAPDSQLAPNFHTQWVRGMLAGSSKGSVRLRAAGAGYGPSRTGC